MNKKKYEQLIEQLSDQELRKHLYLTQILLIIISILFGLFVFKENSTFFEHFHYNLREWLLGILLGVGVVLLDIFLMKVLPDDYLDDGGLNKRIFSTIHFGKIAFIAAIVAFSEEILFRGILQSNLGLLISSMLFALVHYRYLFNKYLFINIVFLSFFIGWIFDMTNNLWVTIWMHFTIDFLLGSIIRYQLFMTKKVKRTNIYRRDVHD